MNTVLENLFVTSETTDEAAETSLCFPPISSSASSTTCLLDCPSRIVFVHGEKMKTNCLRRNAWNIRITTVFIYLKDLHGCLPYIVILDVITTNKNRNKSKNTEIKVKQACLPGTRPTKLLAI